MVKAFAFFFSSSCNPQGLRFLSLTSRPPRIILQLKRLIFTAAARVRLFLPAKDCERRKLEGVGVPGRPLKY